MLDAAVLPGVGAADAAIIAVPVPAVTVAGAGRFNPAVDVEVPVARVPVLLRIAVATASWTVVVAVPLAGDELAAVPRMALMMLVSIRAAVARYSCTESGNGGSLRFSSAFFCDSMTRASRVANDSELKTAALNTGWAHCFQIGSSSRSTPSCPRGTAAALHRDTERAYRMALRDPSEVTRHFWMRSSKLVQLSTAAFTLASSRGSQGAQRVMRAASSPSGHSDVGMYQPHS
mmetsp:Transcript_26798/g.77271  ORF Transcript_26798/g.77271 Transcript_26798/m.77271 type:complete len:232 (+) Transcript_26798:689-1384(+)